MRLLSLSVATVAIAMLVISCNESNNPSYSVEEWSDSASYVRISDAGYFKPEWRTDQTVIYQVLQDPDNLHPTNGKTMMRNEVMLYTQGFLTSVDFKSNKICPSLIMELPKFNADKNEYAYQLRNDIKWDNGETLSANDILFTLKVYKCALTQNDFFKPYLQNMKDVVPDASNPLSFTIPVNKPYIQDVAIWGDIIIMQQNFYDPSNLFAQYSINELSDEKSDALKDPKIKAWFENFNSETYGFDPEKLNGLGPYKVTSWQQGQTLVLEKKKNHWSDNSKNEMEKAFPGKIIFKVSSDPNVNVLEFKKQNFDASTTLSTKSLVLLQNDSVFNTNYHSRFTATFNYSFACFNMRPDSKRKKFFDDVNVRRAIAMLIPYEQINQVIYQGQYKRQTGPVCNHKYNFNHSLKLIEQNKDSALQLLAAAGWSDSNKDGVLEKQIDGQTIDFRFDMNIYAGIPDWNDMALLIASELKKAGMVMTIVPLDVAVFLDRARNHDFDMLMSVWSTSAAPEDYTQLWHSDSWKQHGDNYSGFGNRLSDQLIDSIKYTIDDSIRTLLDQRFQQMVVDDQPYVFLFNSQRRVAVHKRFNHINLYYEKPGLLLNTLQVATPVNKSSVN